MSKIKNNGLDKYGAEPFEQQQLGTAGVEGVNDCMEWTELTFLVLLALVLLGENHNAYERFVHKAA